MKAAPALDALARSALDAARAAGLRIATAESCTGGLVAARLTAIPGASLAFDCALITYSNAAKTRLLGVPEAMLRAHGAVSAEVAAAMAEGALRASGADIAVAITGIAGPDGGSPEKPVGLVHLAATTRAGDMDRIEHHFSARLGRAGIRREAARAALSLLLTLSLRHRTLA